MKLRCRGSDHLKIGEQPIGGDLFGNLTEQCTFTLVLKVMNREPGYNNIERAKWCQWVHQIPLLNADPLVTQKFVSRALEHRWRRIHRRHALHTSAMLEHESGQPAVTANPGRVPRTAPQAAPIPVRPRLRTVVAAHRSGSSTNPPGRDRSTMTVRGSRMWASLPSTDTDRRSTLMPTVPAAGAPRRESSVRG